MLHLLHLLSAFALFSLTAGRGSIAAVAFSPDGNQIAAGGYQVVMLLDAATGRVTAKLTGHAGAVTSLAFSPNGQILAAAGGVPGKGGEIQLWNAQTGKRGRTLTGDTDVIYAIAFSPNGKQIAAASYDHLVSLWNVQEQKGKWGNGEMHGNGEMGKWRKSNYPITRLPNYPITQRPTPNTQHPIILKDHTDAVYGVAFSPDGERLASVAGDRTVKVWDARTGKRLYTLNESTAELYAVAFRPDGKQLAAGGVDKTLRVWNVTATEGKLAHAAFAHDGAILRVAYSHDGATIVTTGEDQAVKRWDAETLEERKVYARQPDWPQGLALSPNDRLLAIGRYDGSLALYDAVTGRQIKELLHGGRSGAIQAARNRARADRGVLGRNGGKRAGLFGDGVNFSAIGKGCSPKKEGRSLLPGGRSKQRPYTVLPDVGLVSAGRKAEARIVKDRPLQYTACRGAACCALPTAKEFIPSPNYPSPQRSEFIPSRNAV